MSSRGRPQQRPLPLQQLPTLRSAVGAALILAAAAGVLSAHSTASAPPAAQYVVVRSDLPAGHVLTPRDLGVVAAELPQGSRALRSGAARSAVGRTTAVALRQLDLLRPSDLERRGSSAGGIVVPLDVAAARVPGPALRPGAVVTVLATDPDSDGTLTVASAATVVAVDPVDDSLGTASNRQIRLQVATAEAASVLVDAAVRSTLTLTLPRGASQDGRR